VVQLGTGQVHHLEALVRWRRADGGMVQPNEFIPIAEQNALVRPLTLWVLREALRQAAKWRDAGLPHHVAVNLSPLVVNDHRLAADISRIIRETAASPDWLTLEITEGALLTDPGGVGEALNVLHQTGASLAIDDFGTGYSSLSRLRGLPVEQLKIDRSFTQDMDTNEDDALFAQSIIQLGHHRHLQVVAEGVETDAARDMLVGMGCDLAQGFVIAAPMSAEDIEIWLQEPQAVAS